MAIFKSDDILRIGEATVSIKGMKVNYKTEFKTEKDDVITNSNRGEKETMNYLKGVKHNQYKPDLHILFRQFPKALQAITLSAQYGFSKYRKYDHDNLNYKRVEGGSNTYKSAMLRHTLSDGLDESTLPHLFHAAWCALASLELEIEEKEINMENFSKTFLKSLHNNNK